MIEVADRLEVRQALGGVSAGLKPLIDRAPDIAGGGQMMRQELGLALDEIGEVLLQCRCDPAMQLSAPGAQQGAVGGVLHQRVLEEIGRLRWDTAAEQQPGTGEPVEPRPHLGAGTLRHLLDQVVAEFATDDRADLPDLLRDRPEPIEPRDQRGV